MSFSSNSMRGRYHKLLIVLLALHTMYGMWESIRFFVVEYQTLELKLAAHTLEQSELNLATTEAFVLVAFTVVSGALALRLHKSHLNQESAETIDLVLSTLLLVFSSFATEYLLKFNLFSFLADILGKLFT